MNQLLRPLNSPITLALLFTLLNSIKPMHMDDACFHYYAAQIAEQPLDPYAFEIQWIQDPMPALKAWTPPGLPYWWAGAIRLSGEQPFAWKLSLLPFSLLFVFSLRAIFRRFASGLENPLLWMTVLSPTFLPSLNLMTDIPALTLSLCALVLFMRACDSDSFVAAALAGLVAGLAMETKYTALVTPATLLLYAILSRKMRLGCVAFVIPILVFVSCDGLIALRQGGSPFLVTLGQQEIRLWAKVFRHILPLVTILGALCPAGLLLGLAALRFSRPVVIAAGVSVVLGYVLLAVIPEESATLWRDAVTNKKRLGVNHVIFGSFGLALIATVVAILRRLCRQSIRESWPPVGLLRYRVEWFLVLWLGLELSGYLVLSPFPAVRRVMAVVIVSTVLIGRLASHTCRLPDRSALVRGVAFAGSLLGLCFFAVDLRDAFAEQKAAQAAARWLAKHATPATKWYAGHWGFQYYAELAGMKPVAPGQTQFREGDWLVIPDSRISQQAIVIDEQRMQAEKFLSVNDSIPLRTVVCYYSGGSPLAHHEGPRVSVTLYRILKDCVAAAPEGLPTYKR